MFLGAWLLPGHTLDGLFEVGADLVDILQEFLFRHLPVAEGLVGHEEKGFVELVEDVTSPLQRGKRNLTNYLYAAMFF